MALTNDQLATWSVNEVVRQFPVTVAVFKRYGIDACCGGALPVSEAAQRHGAVAATVLAELQHAMAVTAAEEEQPSACQLSPRPQSRV
jgi:regulator of cell morphogenesis and NO signaling